ncbi:MAG: hypothetical protein C5B49_11635 [Bdellovibrio sp.]|nr:MAG: hypothetical protein C5B49_11635 [Bdellovibrio sp.]
MQLQIVNRGGPMRRATAALFLPILFFTAGCSKTEKLQDLAQVNIQSIPRANAKVNLCTDPSYDQKQYIKTLIILDHSGSNTSNFLLAADGSGAPALVNGTPVISAQYGTDPTGQLRYGNPQTPGTLLNYLSTLPPNNPTDPTRFFSVINFSDSDDTYPANASGFTSDIADFYNHIQQDATAGGTGPNDNGATNYMAALKSAYDIINNDVQAADRCAKLTLGSASPGAWCPAPGVEVSSTYIIIFMSDGAPIMQISGLGLLNGQVVVTGPINLTYQPTDQILGEVATIMALTSNTKYVTSINLFTIYYYAQGNIDKTGQQLLATMAKAGNGVAYNALSGTNLNYAQFQPPAKRVSFQLADIFVTNSSVIWAPDGYLHPDANMDGVADDIGTPPQPPAGISGLVASELGSNPNLGACSGVNKTNGSFAASDPDGLNDCEKILLGDNTGVGNPDSNGDLIPDWLEFINGVPFQAGTAPAINTPLQDGYTIYQKIKASLPVNVPLQQLHNAVPVTYQTNLISSDNVHDCYQITVQNLPILGDGNTIRVDVLEKSDLLKNKFLYRVAHKAIAPGAVEVDFDDWTSAAEQALKTWQLWN